MSPFTISKTFPNTFPAWTGWLCYFISLCGTLAGSGRESSCLALFHKKIVGQKNSWQMADEQHVTWYNNKAIGNLWVRVYAYYHSTIRRAETVIYCPLLDWSLKYLLFLFFLFFFFFLNVLRLFATALSLTMRSGFKQPPKSKFILPRRVYMQKDQITLNLEEVIQFAFHMSFAWIGRNQRHPSPKWLTEARTSKQVKSLKTQLIQTNRQVQEIVLYFHARPRLHLKVNIHTWQLS